MLGKRGSAVCLWRCYRCTPSGCEVAELPDVHIWDNVIVPAGEAGRGVECVGVPLSLLLGACMCHGPSRVHGPCVQHACSLKASCFCYVDVVACSRCFGGCYLVCALQCAGLHICGLVLCVLLFG
jgi:hypothetical protein